MKKKKAVIITGASSGLGKALFDILAEKDIALCAVSRTFLGAQKEQEAARADIRLFACDLSKTEQVIARAKKLQRDLAGFSEVVFINNAATVEPVGRVGELKDEEIIEAIHTNMAAAVLLTNALCRLRGAALTIIDITSGAADHPVAGWALYCATKAATKMFFDVVKAQDARNGKLSIYEFNPGVMDTAMQEEIRNASPAGFPRLEEFKRLKREGKLKDPREVAERLVREYIEV